MSKKSGTLRIVTIMMIITFAGKALGLLRDAMVGSFFGTDSIEGTAFNIASVLPRVFMDVIFASAIAASFIPAFNEVLEKQGREKAFKLAHNFISVIMTISVIVTIGFIVFASPIVHLIYGNTAVEFLSTRLPEFAGPIANILIGSRESAEALELGADLLQIMLFIIVLSCLAFSLTGVLQSLGEFNAPAAMGFVSNVVILFYMFFFLDYYGVIGLCIAFVAGWLAQLLIQIPFLIRSKFKYRFQIDLRDEGLKRIGLLMLPVMVSTWVTPINLMVNGMAAMSDYYGRQSFNATNFAYNLYAVLGGVLVLSVTNVIFPRLSVQAANVDHEAFGENISQTIRGLFFLLIPMSIGLVALSEPIVRLFYERGQWTQLSTRLTSTALVYFSLGMCGFGLQSVLARGFYAFQEGKVPMMTSILAIVANLFLSYILVGTMGVGGPALASSISISIAALIMLWLMSRKIAGILNVRLCLDLMKMLVIGLVLFGVAVNARDYLFTNLDDNTIGRILVIAVPTIMGIIVYIGLSMIVRLPEAMTTLGILKKYLRRG